MTERLDYEVVDVFTDTAFTGNPLAVVLGADALAAEQLQAIAREFNLSETAFPMPAEGAADYRLRIFTPSVELPFAGHPSIGAAWVLAQRGILPQGDVVQECGAGLLPLTINADAVTLTGGAPTCGPAGDPAPWLAALGLTAADGDGDVRTAGCGLPFTFLPVRADALERLRPNLAALRAISPSESFGGLSVYAWDDSTARVRVLAYGAGVDEDPATGSAALGLGVHLVAAGLHTGGRYEVHQGVEMGRPSHLCGEVDVVDGRVVAARITGQVVPVATGQIRVP